MWQHNLEHNLNRESYFEMCKQLNEEPEYDKIPPELEDFPEDVQLAISIFGKLGDIVVADIGYLGKDYTALPLHMQIAEITDQEVFLETLLRLDERVKKRSAEMMQREREKLKRKQ